MLAQHRFVRVLTHHQQGSLFLNRRTAVAIAATAILTCFAGTALAKGGNIRRSEPIPLSQAGTPTSPSATEVLGGCGRGRYRDPSTRKCRGPADFGN
jgi:hypothetical protein